MVNSKGSIARLWLRLGIGRVEIREWKLGNNRGCRAGCLITCDAFKNVDLYVFLYHELSNTYFATWNIVSWIVIQLSTDQLTTWDQIV